jgi:hypothetical protein
VIAVGEQEKEKRETETRGSLGSLSLMMFGDDGQLHRQDKVGVKIDSEPLQPSYVLTHSFQNLQKKNPPILFPFVIPDFSLASIIS